MALAVSTADGGTMKMTLTVLYEEWIHVLHNDFINKPNITKYIYLSILNQKLHQTITKIGLVKALHQLYQ